MTNLCRKDAYNPRQRTGQHHNFVRLYGQLPMSAYVGNLHIHINSVYVGYANECYADDCCFI